MTEYIDVPIETDPEQLAQDAFTDLQARAPGWVPNAGNLDTWLLEATARMAAEVRDTASKFPKTAFRFMGELAGVLPIDATPATVTTTWTMIDAAGYTIPDGTLAGIRTAGDTIEPFQVVGNITIPAGATVATSVPMIALTPGEAGSGLGAPAGPLELIDTLANVLSITQDAVTTGGVDAEDDTVYLNRLRTQLQLLAPRPIVPSDFAAIAQNTAGIERALAIDGYVPAVDEIETITVTATGGTFTLTFSGQTTAAIAWNASATTVRLALEALSNLAPGDVIVTGGPLPGAPLSVEFAGAQAGTNVTQMTVATGSLTGGTATIATSRSGAAALTAQARSITVAVVDENGNTPSGAAMAALAAALQAQREVNFVVSVIGPTYTQVEVHFTYTTLPGYDPAAVGILAEAAIAAYLSPADWGQPKTGDRRAWINTPTINRLELATVLNNVQGLDAVTALTLGANGGSMTATDFTLTGPAAMPTILDPVTDIVGTAA